jgi:hypothetical protein
MTEFLAAAGRKEIPFVRAALGSCSVGWKREDGREVQAQVLSGGEWCVFAAAITSAVILIRPSDLKILLIEAGEGDGPTLRAIMKGIDGIANGLTAAVVMTHADTLADYSKDWKVINVRTDERVEATRPAGDKPKTKKGDRKDGATKTGTAKKARRKAAQS